MKNLKKLSGILLAIAVLLACTVSAFAAGSTAEANTGKITVENSQSGKTYKAYKIFDVTYSDTATNPVRYTYTIDTNSKWFDRVSSYATTEGSGLTLSDTVTDTSGKQFKIVTFTDGTFSAAKFAKALNAAEPPVNAPFETLSGTPATKDGLALGYYLVTTGMNTIANLTTTNNEVTIYDKQVVNFNKVDDKQSVQIGDTVNFTITDKVPDVTGFSTYKYEITDTMTSGLSLTMDSIVVKIDNVVKTVDTDFTLANVTATGFTLTIKKSALEGKATKDIEVTYNATVTKDAITQVSTNTAKLTYNNDPADLTSEGSKTIITKVYSSEIKIDKYAVNEDTTHKQLANAEFVLINNISGDPENGKYYKVNESTGVVSWVADINDATVMKTGADGYAYFKGLKDGDYKLKETVAPDGYNLLKDPVPVTVNGSKEGDVENAKNIETTENNTALLTTISEVENKYGSLLPSTGGIGTTIFYIVGGVLVAAAVVLLVAKKRTSENR